MADDERQPQALAVYGTLAPGEPNHWVISRIAGEWQAGTARGYVFEISWGPAEGYQGFIPDDDGAAIEMAVLVSDQLPSRWREIDDFEGAGYERRQVPVTLESGSRIDAWTYVALTDS